MRINVEYLRYESIAREIKNFYLWEQARHSVLAIYQATDGQELATKRQIISNMLNELGKRLHELNYSASYTESEYIACIQQMHKMNEI